MGKLTYINRKIEGGKLAQVVVRDIIKRIPPNIAYKTALRDPVVEFDVSSKTVDDKGLKDISKALLAAVRQHDPGRVLILEEVSFKNNKFTSAGILSLAPVIRSSSSEIKNLDLSDNLIEVKTAEDALAWEQFLKSFSKITTLRRLDLSGNKLGQKGFEILSKVWAAEDGVLVCEETGQARTCGLQSIPYICLADTGLDGLGATYLSYILENHKFVQELLPLVPQAKPGNQTHQLEVLNEVKGCNGLIWKPNEDIQGPGQKMLEYAEVVRNSRRDSQGQDVVDESMVQAVGDLGLADAPRRSSTDRRSRGDSFISIDDSFHITSSNITSDLARARSRIQLNALKDEGLRQNDLWIASFRMLRYTRILLFGSNLAQRLVSATPNQKMTIVKNVTQDTQAQVWPSLPAKPTTIPSSITTLRLVRPGTQKRPVLQNGNPNASLSIKEPPSKDRIVTRASQVQHTRNRSKQKCFIDHLSTETRLQYASPYKSNLIAGLSDDVWTCIIAYAADAEGVLSDNQKRSIVRWGASRESILELHALRGKHESQQAYKALEAMSCLSYGI